MFIQKRTSMLLSNNQIGNIYKNNMTQKNNSSDNSKNEKEKVVDLAITDRSRGNAHDYYTSSNNVQSAISRIQVAENSLTSINDMLLQMTELCIQAAKHKVSPEDRHTISSEIQQLKIKLAQTTDSTKFNDENLFDDFSLESLGLSDIDLTTPEAAELASSQISNAANTIEAMRNDLAASKQELESSPEPIDLNRSFKIDDDAFRDDVLSHAKESMLSQYSDDRELVMSLLR